MALRAGGGGHGDLAGVVAAARHLDVGGDALAQALDVADHADLGYKRDPPVYVLYCICRDARGEMRRIIHPFQRVTAQASRNSAHDGEGEGKRGLGMGFHRVNYTIFAALRIGFRGRFPWPRKVSVVRREQIRVLNPNRHSLSTFQPLNFSTFQPA